MFRSTVFLIVFSLVLTAAPLAQAEYQADNTAESAGEAGDINTARMQVKISELEEQIRKLQGTVEQLNFQNQQLKTDMEKQKADMEFRLTAMEKKQAEAAAVMPNPAAATPAAPVSEAAPATADAKTADPIPEESQAGDDAAAEHKFATPRELYNYAFDLLNHTKYAEAGDYFAKFTKKYPKDPLIGNAYYWLGETRYVRHDYLKAADSFRLGYEAMPAGPKASDNLLKLAMSLNALNKDKDACVVLRQVVIKFGASSSGVKARAEAEINRIGCSN